jgi:hypothetical protein
MIGLLARIVPHLSSRISHVRISLSRISHASLREQK